MNLRRQLLLVSLLLLSLPWAGCQFIREMEGALRQGQVQSLQASANAVAAVVAQDETLLYPNPQRRSATLDEAAPLYAFAAAGPVLVDGYGDGWQDVPARRFRNETGDTTIAVSVQAQTRGDLLYLLLRVEDEQVVYHNPGVSTQANGDRLVLRLWRDDRRQDYVIATAAPGSVQARWDGRRQRGIDPGRIRGFWQDAVGGYTLELAIPLEYTGSRLGFFIVDEDGEAGGTRSNRSTGNTSRLESTPPPWLVYQPRALRDVLAAFTATGGHIHVLDRQAWQVARLKAAKPAERPGDETFWLLRLVYRSVLQGNAIQELPVPIPGQTAGVEVERALAGAAANMRYRDPASAQRTLLSAAAPVRDAQGILGAVVVRQSSETYLSLTDQAFSRLLGYSLLALCAGALGLLAYATVLSLRIHALSRSAHEAIGQDGRVLDNFRRSRARDEIGDLSRQYGDLLARLREYNDYLRTLSRKLSHELRTPIAVIQSSLDNIEQADTDAARQTYLPRAREGLRRLQHILSAMSEANGLEESIRNQSLGATDLVPLLREVHAAYREIYPQQQLALDLQPETAVVEAVPELLVQALDKLMDNAASFTQAGGVITLELRSSGEHYTLAVANEGPTLDEHAAERMFEPMVSLREDSGEAVHLGLGLHIVRLIVDFHRGRVQADNLPGGRGVVITIELPAAQDGASLQTPAA